MSRSYRVVAVALMLSSLSVIPAVAQDASPSPGIAPQVLTTVPDAEWCASFPDPDACLALVTAISTVAQTTGSVPESIAGLFAAAPVEETGGTATESPVKFSGKGEKVTKPFDLAGGDYEMTIKVSGDSDCPEYITVYLEDGAGDTVESLQQSGYLYGIEGGRYHFEVSTLSSCKWSVVIRPFG